MISFVPFQATVQLKQAFKDPAIIPALCAVMSSSQNPQVLCMSEWEVKDQRLFHHLESKHHFHSECPVIYVVQALHIFCLLDSTVSCSDAADKSEEALEEDQS